MSDQAASRVVVITGGSSGIGLCTANLFAARGWRVGLIARGEPALAAAKAGLVAAGATCATASADVADDAALEAAATALEAELGPIAVWVNDAGTSFYAPFLDMTPDEFQRVVDVSFVGGVNGTRAALRRMKPRDRGSIVTVGSALGFRGIPLQSPYCASKFALRGFTEAIRAELIHERSRVHVGMVHPPSVNTPFFSHAGSRMQGQPRPVPPVYEPEIMAEAIWLCAIERRREIKITGTSVALAALNSVAPALSDRLAAWTGVASQQSHDPTVAARRDISFTTPGTGPARVHGPFGSEAFKTSAQMWATRNPWLMGAGLAVLGALALPRSGRGNASRRR